MSELTSAEFRLQAFMADNDAGEGGKTRARLRLVNSRRLHRTSVLRKAPQSTYAWTLDDATIIGFPDIKDRDAAKVFAIALSMQSWRFLHSPVILSTVSALHVRRRGPVLSAATELTSPLLIVDERSFVEAATALKRVCGMSGSRGKIMRGALNAYWDALHSVRTRSRFLSLWAALELAVNAERPEGKELEGDSLDRRAGEITGALPEEIRPLRELNNRLKHARALRTYYSEIAAHVGKEAAELKTLVDKAIASQSGFSLSATYDG